jgi:SOS-response transcriptional repressor LexA
LLSGKDENACAVLLICLSDQYREIGKFGEAVECSKLAKRFFCPFIEIRHRHNYAVAAYSLGLAEQFDGSEEKALAQYDEALEQFLTAEQQWILDGQDTWRERCEAAIHWIEKLRQRLTQTHAAGQPPPRRVHVPVLSAISAGEPRLASEDFDEWLPLDPGAPDRVNFALRVDGDSMIGAGISDGDLVLIEQDESQPPNGTIVAILVDQTDAEAVLKRFYREKDHIRLEPANVNHPFIILADGGVLAPAIHDRYLHSYPNRRIQVRSDVNPRIVGRMRDALSGASTVILSS